MTLSASDQSRVIGAAGQTSSLYARHALRRMRRSSGDPPGGEIPRSCAHQPDAAVRSDRTAREDADRGGGTPRHAIAVRPRVRNATASPDGVRDDTTWCCCRCPAGSPRSDRSASSGLLATGSRRRCRAADGVRSGDRCAFLPVRKASRPPPAILEAARRLGRSRGYVGTFASIGSVGMNLVIG